MKKINLRGIKESLSEKEMKLVKGGEPLNFQEDPGPQPACSYSMRCDQTSSSSTSVSDCSRSTAVSTCGEAAVGSGSVVCVQTGSC